ncbi:Peptidyl-prolyl cis-trans isomerase, putative [Candida maltosa Xu316]|uniref:Peptidyl-prolyl cis-trans isomerase, putative n=1 Tax=Candida maltosa (strain Xu316) TaxID=1245528 RepID=M3JUW2_CANMX|nr:Peptidyl-prolyl cis-trans isomerase, putative [Candida maltosa Xu316]
MISGTASSESPSLPSIPFENQDDLSESFKLCISANDKHQIDPRNFFITFSPQPSLSRDHSVIGEVIHGKSILRELESVKTDDNHSPTVPIQITDCGEWTQGMPIPVYNASYSDIGGDIYEEYPMDDTNFNQESTEEAFAVSDKIKESGTLLFKKGEKQQARFKYRKSLVGYVTIG